MKSMTTSFQSSKRQTTSSLISFRVNCLSYQLDGFIRWIHHISSAENYWFNAFYILHRLIWCYHDMGQSLFYYIFDGRESRPLFLAMEELDILNVALVDLIFDIASVIMLCMEQKIYDNLTTLHVPNLSQCTSSFVLKWCVLRCML